MYIHNDYVSEIRVVMEKRKRTCIVYRSCS